MENYIDPKALENGNVLRQLKQDLVENRTKEDFISLLGCLRDSMVWVPVSAQISTRDQDSLTKVKTGDIWTSQDEIRFRPDILLSPDQKRWFPIFSQKEQIPDEYSRSFSIVRLSALRCLNMAHNTENVGGLILDAFTIPLELPFGVADIMTKLGSRLKPEPSGDLK